jgi:hypothetical protein
MKANQLSQSLFPFRYETTMVSVTFMSPNTSTQARSKRIPQSVWEEYKDDIVQAYRQGGKLHGVARAHQLIQDLRVDHFSPR